MTQVTVADFCRDPAGCLRRVEAGEAILLVEDGRPIAEIRPVRSADDPDLPEPHIVDPTRSR
jgi:antitoxin (DNA-binding transcriptional repressor) of toxin-antitoxin stability system